MTYNVLRLGGEAELEVQMFSLAQMFIRIPNVQFSTEAAIEPNACWQLVFYLFHLTTISACTSILKPPVLSKNDFLSAVSITVKLGCFLLHAKAFL